MGKCIYCNTNQANSIEHHLPEALGNFLGYKKLYDKLCVQCNSNIGNIEGSFLRTSEVGAMRRYFSITGKKRDKNENPFYQAQYKTPPIKIHGIDPWDGKEKMWELRDKGVVQLEAIYVTLKNKERVTIPLPPEKQTPEGILTELKTLSIYPQNIEKVEIDCDQENIHKIENALETTIPNPNKTEWFDSEDKSPKIVDVKITSVRSMQYYQAIAKIGFHYALTYCDYYTGNEKEFNNIKRYIMNGCSHPDEISKFVVENRKHLLYRMREGFVPENVGHLIIMNISPGSIKVNIQLFIGSQLHNLPWIYPFAVNIGKNPQRIACNFTIGHYFYYYKDGKQEGFDGEISEISSLYQ